MARPVCIFSRLAPRHSGRVLGGVGASSDICRQMNMRQKAYPLLLLLTAALILSNATICRASSPVAPICFTNEVAAFTNGQAVLAGLKSGDAQSKKVIQGLVGSRVLFDGLESGNGLKLGENIFLEVEGSSPPREGRPHARNWADEIVGVLKSVDFEKRVIHIKARPEGWKSYGAD